MKEEASQFWSCLDGAVAQGLEDHGNKVICFSNGSDSWYLKQRTSLELCDKDLRVVEACEAAGVPVARPLLTDDGQTYARHGEYWWTLTAGLPGGVLTDMTQDAARHTGSAIATFQNVFRGASFPSFPGYDSSLTSLIRRLQALGDREPEGGRLLSIFEGFADEAHLTRGVIHRDPHPRNMCLATGPLSSGPLSGIFDFDLVKHGPLIFDPCYCANSQLAYHWTLEDEPDVWLGILAGIMDGYFANVHPAFDERAHIFEMLLKAQLIFFVWLRETGQDEAADSCRQYIFWMTEKGDAIEAAIGV